MFEPIAALLRAARIPARVEVPVNAIPAGMTLEEWNAMPEVGMPDVAHVTGAGRAQRGPRPTRGGGCASD